MQDGKLPPVSEHKQKTTCGEKRLEERVVERENQWKNNNEKNFILATQDAFLKQYVDFPTRDKSILDLVFSNETDRILRVTGAGKIGKSDHEALEVTVLGKQHIKEVKREFLDWPKADTEALKAELSSYEWEEDIKANGVESAWKLIRDRLLNAQGETVPQKEMKSKNNPGWLTRDVQKAMRKKQRRWKASKNYGGEENRKRYMDEVKATQKAIRDG